MSLSETNANSFYLCHIIITSILNVSIYTAINFGLLYCLFFDNRFVFVIFLYFVAAVFTASKLCDFCIFIRFELLSLLQYCVYSFDVYLSRDTLLVSTHCTDSLCLHRYIQIRLGRDEGAYCVYLRMHNAMMIKNVKFFAESLVCGWNTLYGVLNHFLIGIRLHFTERILTVLVCTFSAI